MEFLKTCAAGGLLALLPMLIFAVLIPQALGLVVALATPIADLFPPSTFENIEAPELVAIVLIVATSFLFGLALRSRELTRVGRWLETHTVARLPMYSAIKHLTLGFDAPHAALVVRPTVIDEADGDACALLLGQILHIAA